VPAAGCFDKVNSPCSFPHTVAQHHQSGRAHRRETGAATVFEHRQTVAVTWPGGLPAGYQVSVTHSMKAMCWVTSKSATSFTVNLDNGGTIAAGTIDLLVISG
jgi:hypothetical protein